MQPKPRPAPSLALVISGPVALAAAGTALRQGKLRLATAFVLFALSGPAGLLLAASAAAVPALVLHAGGLR
ncbi:hypothetical protein [Rhodobacter sp. CZR27]|uniref:hypothetical protein n=1 Tax=Rhodobacter sp. CZR27 TaxID=2033869 RepID=UPI000BBE957E|nr:hypothetical protein [Rhodobacter sp. CZR27]